MSSMAIWLSDTPRRMILSTSIRKIMNEYQLIAGTVIMMGISLRQLRTKKKIALHRLVMNASADEQIDHINHQKENACKSNLRRVSHQENSFNGTLAKNNTSGRTGVNFNKRSKKWISRLMKSGKSIFLGAFDTFEEAVAARKAAEEKYFGDYSYDNSIAASPLIEVV